MKRFFCIYFAISYFTASTCFAAFHVVIDPGHGGSDLGTSRDSFVESQIVLHIAQKIKTQIEELPTQNDLQVTLTRLENSFLTLPQRVQVANDLKADLFISLHANSSRSSLVSGFEFYFSHAPNSTNSVDQKKSIPAFLKKEEDIVEKIKQDLTLLGKQKLSLEFSQQTQKQGQQIEHNQKSVIRRAPFYVIENTSMPAVLIEVGFISNRREAKKLASPEYQTKIASLLTQSILKYKEKSDKKLFVNEK
jgi:N-acetylmuramoyl-L-alanine amidase